MKKFKTLGYVLSLALGMTMLTGCGKKVDGVIGKLIDLTAVFALLAGTATTFSPGRLQGT